MNRRGFLQSCLILASAPAIVRISSLMKLPPQQILTIPWQGDLVALAVAEKIEQLGKAIAKSRQESLAAYKLNWFAEQQVPLALAAGWERIIFPHSLTPGTFRDSAAGRLEMLQLDVATSDFYKE